MKFSSLSSLVLATYNPGKVAELKLILPSTLTILSAADFEGQEPEETGTTFQENAEIKATYWCYKTGIPSLADDSGICLTALGGQPGVKSKDFLAEQGGTLEAFDTLKNHPALQKNPQAAFICVLALATLGEKIRFYEGRCEGQLVFPARGDQGHGYDPIFQPQGSDKTFAEMNTAEKNQYSHRGRALHLFLKENFHEQ